MAFCGLGCAPLHMNVPVRQGAMVQNNAVKMKIARKIWQNECAGSVNGLVSWNKGENFPSLGIGHFIWYPAGVHERFEESLPSLMAFGAARGVTVPTFFKRPAPWRNRADFMRADVKGGLPDKMRQWLSSPVAMQLQADFIIRRSLMALSKMKKHSAHPADIESKYHKVASTPNGMYALIDYVNFKGEGINAAERYSGQGWGLLQVLEEMKFTTAGQAAAVEFAEAAKRVLTRRVNNSPAQRGETRWLPGWKNRCDTYKKSL